MSWPEVLVYFARKGFTMYVAQVDFELGILLSV